MLFRALCICLALLVGTTACSGEEEGIASPHSNIDAKSLAVDPAPTSGGKSELSATISDVGNYAGSQYVDLEREDGSAWRTLYVLKDDGSGQSTYSKAKKDQFKTLAAVPLQQPLHLSFPTLEQGHYRLVREVSANGETPTTMSWAIEFDIS